MNGIDCFFEGLRLVRQPGLRRYVVIPIIINTIILSIVMVYGISQYDAMLTTVMSFLPDWLQFLSVIIGILAAIVVFTMAIYCFSIVANIISSPFNAVLSVKVEEVMTGKDSTSEVNIFLVLGRAISREISKLMYFLPRLLGLLLLSVIPGINAVAPFAWILFGAWMMAIQYTDYAADNNEVSFKDLKRDLASETIQSLLFGILVYFVVAIPILNLVLIPVAVAGGTVFWVEYFSKSAVK